MCCFVDCKCNSLKRRGENIKQNRKKQKQKQNNSKNNINTNRNTGYPALDPTANKYLSGSGWEMIVVSVVVVYVFMCCCCYSCYVLFVCICVFFDCKCNSLKRQGEHMKPQQHKETYNKTEQHSNKNNKQQKYMISSPRTSANNLFDLFAEVRGLDILYVVCVCYVFL